MHLPHWVTTVAIAWLVFDLLLLLAWGGREEWKRAQATMRADREFYREFMAALAAEKDKTEGNSR